MFSIQKCRELLGGKACTLSDSEIELLRNEIYRIAGTVISAYIDLQEKSKSDSGGTDITPFSSSLRLLPEDERESVEERAAMMQHDGKMPRRIAEQAALYEHRKQRRNSNRNTTHNNI